jgi:hypothetical protein
METGPRTSQACGELILGMYGLDNWWMTEMSTQLKFNEGRNSLRDVFDPGFEDVSIGTLYFIHV